MVRQCGLILLATTWLSLAHAAKPDPTLSSLEAYSTPSVSIIIDDLGRDWKDGLRAARLPGPITCAFLPHDRYTGRLATIAHGYNKEVMLHLPMQPVEDRPLDAGGLSLHMTHREFLQTLDADLKSVPYVVGVNNHMGSLLTRHPGHMLWLMQELDRRGDLFFVDSRTTKATVALRVAQENHVPSVKRDVFLDNDRSPAAIRRQVMTLVALARTRGSAVAIGHPHPTTLTILEEMIPRLHDYGVQLIPLSKMIQRTQTRRQLWQASLSPSPKDARSLKLSQ